MDHIMVYMSGLMVSFRAIKLSIMSELVTEPQ